MFALKRGMSSSCATKTCVKQQDLFKKHSLEEGVGKGHQEKIEVAYGIETSLQFFFAVLFRVFS